MRTTSGTMPKKCTELTKKLSTESTIEFFVIVVRTVVDVTK